MDKSSVKFDYFHRKFHRNYLFKSNSQNQTIELSISLEWIIQKPFIPKEQKETIKSVSGFCLQVSS